MQVLDVKTDQQTDWSTIQSHIRQKLRCMNLGRLRYGFYFDDNNVFNQEVQPIRDVQRLSLIHI